MPIDPVAIIMAKRFEPILLFHPDEKFFPIDPKFYLEHCALWRSVPPSDKKQDWGELPHNTFPRRPQLDKGMIAALKDEASGGKTWIGDPGHLVIPEPTNERPLGEDRFLQLIGWEPLVNAPKEVTGSSENRHPTLDFTRYNAALPNSRRWYYAEYFSHENLLELARNNTPHGINLLDMVKKLGDTTTLLVYHFFYALHEEPLRGCEEAGEGKLFATFAGEWTSVAILANLKIDSQVHTEPLFIGVTSRNVGDPKSIPNEENRIGMFVHPWKKVSRVDNHPKIFVSRGTHGNYLTAGVQDLTPFTPGDIDLSMGTCAEIEKLDEVIPGGEEVSTQGKDSDFWVILAKAAPTLGLGFYWASAEGALSSFGTHIPAIQPNRKPQDETGGPLFGLILRPEGLFVSEQASTNHIEDWKTKMPAPADRLRYDFIVDREAQSWWPPRGEDRGYAGRWGPRVTNDPKTRRSGMRCPPFALMFLEGLARI
jgi:hypothetical protein